MRRVFLSLFLIFNSWFLAPQEVEPFLSVEAYNEAQLLFLNESSVLSFHDTKTDYVIRLLDGNGKEKDEFIFPKPEQPRTKSLLYKLSIDRFFLTVDGSSFNFCVEKGEISLTDKKPFPSPPRGTVKTMYFFDGPKSATVFLNNKEQYNVYLDSAGIRLGEKETFNTSHIGNISGFAKRLTQTPDFIYSYQTKELFFHMPTDVSFLSLDLKKNEIDIGLIYLEYKQKYVFRRYFDQISGERYAVKQDGKQFSFFETPSFGVARFSESIYALTDPLSLKYIPEAVINEKVLIRRGDKKRNENRVEYNFYLMRPENTNKLTGNK